MSHQYPTVGYFFICPPSENNKCTQAESRQNNGLAAGGAEDKGMLMVQEVLIGWRIAGLMSDANHLPPG